MWWAVSCITQKRTEQSICRTLLAVSTKRTRGLHWRVWFPVLWHYWWRNDSSQWYATRFSGFLLPTQVCYGQDEPEISCYTKVHGRASELPLYLKEKLEKLLTQLKNADIIREKGDDGEMGSLFVNPIILVPKNDYVKLVIDTRYLNSVTDLTNSSWPLEPVQMIMTRIICKVISVSDLFWVYHQVPLSPGSQKLTSFIIGGRQCTNTWGFCGLSGLPNFSSRLMTFHSVHLIKKKQAVTYIDDTILQSQNKNEKFTIIIANHTLLRKAGLKAAPDKTFFFLKKVKFLGLVISPEGTQPIAKRVKYLKNLKSPERKRDVMKALGCLGCYSCYIKNLHVDSQPFYDLIKNSTSFHWTDEHERHFQSIKRRISEDTILPYLIALYSQPFYNLIKNSTSFHWTDEHERHFQSITGRIS